jgi:hypothetical protein
MRKALEPYIKLAPFVGIGLVAVAIVIAWILYMQRGAQIELVGSIQKVRTLPLDDNSTAAVLDFRLRNPSDYSFVVRKVDVTMLDPSGQTQDGLVVAEVDAKRLFDYYPVLGQKFNQTLLIRTKIKPRETIDRMLMVRFDAPEKMVQQRKSLSIRIEEVDGAVTEITGGGI